MMSNYATKSLRPPLMLFAIALSAIVALTCADCGTAGATTPTPTPNPTTGSAPGNNGGTLEVAIYAYSNGLFVSYSGYGGLNGAGQVIAYTTGGPLTYDSTPGCQGPSFSYFIPLPPGLYGGSASLEGAVGGGVPEVQFTLDVGANGLSPAPAASCVLPVLTGGSLHQPVVGMAESPNPNLPGYWLAGADGSVESFGTVHFYGSMAGLHLNSPIVGITATADGLGYWLLGQDGGIFSYGDAQFYGSTGSIHLNKPVVAMVPTPDGGGYWFVASDGGIFSYGDAQFYGSTGSIHLNKPVVGMAATPDGGGYWLVASDGGIFAFGDAKFHGSMGGTPLNQPVVGMAANPATGGYWMVASDGGVFSFNAPFYGSTGSIHLAKPIVGMTNTPGGGGYGFVASDGGVFNYGDFLFYGSGA